jgi:hypothetical protein
MSVRWPIIRTLVVKEALRLAANRGALVLAALLVAAAGLLAAFDPAGERLANRPRRLDRFWVDYWNDGPWVDYLKAHLPEELRPRVRFRSEAEIPRDRRGTLGYVSGEGSVQLRPATDGPGEHYLVWFWYSGGDPAALAPFEDWFWRATRQFFHEQAVRALPGDRQDEARRLQPPPPTTDPVRLLAELESQYRDRLAVLAAPGPPPPLPELEVRRSALRTIDIRRAVATGLVLFSLFFACVYVQSSLTCEEREHGVLLAQAISPATAGEIVAAKAIVFAGCGVLLAAPLAGICQPAVLAAPFFWLATIVAATGLLGVGVVIASLARTQRAASVAALSYTLTVALLILVTGLTGLRGLSWLMLEYHLPRMLQAALDGTVQPFHWLSLVATTALAMGWLLAALILFRRRGWQ